VCHGGTVNVFLAHVLGLDRPLFFEPEYTSISRVAASRNGPRSVVSINETGHLRDLAVP
jgi:probable phosphoglycerate mutase